jgi:hypothetical protein
MLAGGIPKGGIFKDQTTKQSKIAQKSLLVASLSPQMIRDGYTLINCFKSFQNGLF